MWVNLKVKVNLNIRFPEAWEHVGPQSAVTHPAGVWYSQPYQGLPGAPMHAGQMENRKTTRGLIDSQLFTRPPCTHKLSL